MSGDNDPCSVKVAVRVRPLVASEISRGCEDIIESVKENNQIIIKSGDKAFTFNYVLGTDSPQGELYEKCVEPIIQNLFKGLNVTIFAYGQTGSGKTYTMGTNYQGEGDMGVIPRAVTAIFSHIKDNFTIDFTTTVSFTELYQEVLYDLLANKPRDQCTLEVREDINRGIYLPNVTEVPVCSPNDVLDILVKGSGGRAVGCTAMNSQSSRSHAIFTLSIAMQHKTNKNENKTAKLNLVDLAGSERSKKTGAVGNTFKEGVNINKGLFSLGNVISSLGDEKAKDGFIPYRDSILTRLLKDSLGGNSITLMIACVSPADYNMDETISTLRYADRARRIKNKPVVNQDPKLAEINELKRQVKSLQLQIVGQGGPIVSTKELEKLKEEIKEQNIKIRELRAQISGHILEKTGLHEKILILQNSNEVLTKRLGELKDQYNTTFSNISSSLEKNDVETAKVNLVKMQQIQAEFTALHTDQIKTETEIRNHEEAFSSLLQTANNSMSEEFQEKQESHTNRQINLHSELQALSKELHVKEQLAKQLQINTRYMVDDQAMLETENKIRVLEKEKDELQQQLRNVKTLEASGKIAEQRRKRVQELEEHLKELRKKIQEQSRLIKMKEKDEIKIKQLNQEIVQMKQTKVKLLKNMKEEAQRYQQWKQQSERELIRMRQEGNKKQNEINKMKDMHAKQQNVLKRKFEEAASLNKRLQHTLTLRKQAQEMKISGKIERIVPWLKQELELFLNFQEAETALTGLYEDRALLQQQLNQLKSVTEAAESPEVKAIEEDIHLRSLQIQNFNQKLLDSDEDTKSKTRFDCIQTMAEAKVALKTLFEQAAEIHKNNFQTNAKIKELQDVISDLSSQIKRNECDIKASEERFADQLSAQQQTYEEKVAILLRQLRGVKSENESGDSQLLNRCQMQCETIEAQEKQIEEKNVELKQQEDKISEQAEMIEILKEKLDTIKKTSMQAAKTKAEPSTPDNSRPHKKKIPKIKVESGEPHVERQDASTPLSDVSLDEDNPEKDPDWRKTPLGRRILQEKQKNKLLSRATFNIEKDPEDSVSGLKRSSDGGCTCKTKCQSGRCGCRKTNKGCSSFCKCNESVCENRVPEVSSSEGGDADRYSTDEASSTQNSVYQDANGTFKKPRDDEEENVNAPDNASNRKFLTAHRALYSFTSRKTWVEQVTQRTGKKSRLFVLPS